MTNKSFAIRKLRLALILAVFQLLAVQVHPQRDTIRGEYKRSDRDRVGSSYEREERPNSSGNNDIVGDNDISNNNDSSNNDSNNDTDQDASLNLVLVPQCDPSNSDSFYSQSKRVENRDSTDYLEDTTTDCDGYFQYCDKKRSNLSMAWPNFVYPNDFYNTVEVLYDQCFKSCVENLPGGVEEFCSMPEPRDDASTAEFNSASSGFNEYCGSVGNSDWTAEMMAHEASILEALNNQRGDPGGKVCTRKSRDSSGQTVVTQGFFPRSSPVITNDSLRCAARIQARNIVKATIELNSRFPPNLHEACPSSNFDGSAPVCETFSTRMVNAGYSYHKDGFGYINEVTAVGYRSAETVIQGWLGSQSGHCSAIVKQESLVVPTEVGIGYYRDEETGNTGHVMLLGQRQL
jgi:hypothetical protein